MKLCLNLIICKRNQLQKEEKQMKIKNEQICKQKEEKRKRREEKKKGGYTEEDATRVKF